MLFTSLQFYIFFAAVSLVYFTLPMRCRIAWLLIASFGYYAILDWRFLFILLGDTLGAYVFANVLSRSENNRIRKVWVTVAGFFFLGILGYFKYFNFFNDSFQTLFEKLGLPYLIPHMSIILPIGISFYSFQLYGYVIDVYRKKCEAEKNLVTLGVFASFFPQTAAGPIGRAPMLIPQIKKPQNFSVVDLSAGIEQILWGLFKKVVVADRLAAYVNVMFSSPGDHSGISLLLAAYLFTFQIYCDFSGYSDIAIGCARILGFRLMQNFNLPYFSQNISDFWRRWHISLSSWFGDYLYIPLGGNRVSRLCWIRNIMVVFLISGLWHGANWTFVIWGGLHGIYYFIAFAWKKLFPELRLWKWLKILITFQAVSFAWIFFRAKNFPDAIIVIERIFKHWGQIQWSGSLISMALMFPFLAMLVMIEFAFYVGWLRPPSELPAKFGLCRVTGYSLLAIIIALFGVSNASFIYLQF